LAQQVAEEVREHFPDQTLHTAIPRSVRISEAPSYAQTALTYDAGSTGALAYLEASREIARRGIEPQPASEGDTTPPSADSPGGGGGGHAAGEGVTGGEEQGASGVGHWAGAWVG